MTHSKKRRPKNGPTSDITSQLATDTNRRFLRGLEGFRLDEATPKPLRDLLEKLEKSEIRAANSR